MTEISLMYICACTVEYA